MRNVKTLDELRSYLRSVPEIESGGCGVAGLVMYEWLKKEGKTPEIYFIYPKWFNDPNYYANELALNGKGKAVAPYHCVIKEGGKYFDLVEEASELGSFTLAQPVSEQILKEAVGNKESWNQEFNRGKYLPEIEKNTGINLVV